MGFGMDLRDAIHCLHFLAFFSFLDPRYHSPKSSSSLDYFCLSPCEIKQDISQGPPREIQTSISQGPPREIIHDISQGPPREIIHDISQGLLPISMLIFHKILPVFFLPIGLGILVLVIGALFRKWIVVWLGVVLLWVLSIPVTGDWLMRQTEGVETRVAVESLGKADAAVVLGGMTEQVPGVRYGEWGEAADRFEGGVEVFRAGKAPLLIFMGAKQPWRPEEKPEGEILAERAIRLGVPEEAVRVTERVGNTADEARAVKELLAGIESPEVILVTSAFHMNRASMLFRNAGIEVQPVPVDFRTSYYNELTLIDFLPSADGVENSEIAMKEMLGTLYYKVVASLGN